MDYAKNQDKEKTFSTLYTCLIFYRIILLSLFRSLFKFFSVQKKGRTVRETYLKSKTFGHVHNSYKIYVCLL